MSSTDILTTINNYNSYILGKINSLASISNGEFDFPVPIAGDAGKILQVSSSLEYELTSHPEMEVTVNLSTYVSKSELSSQSYLTSSSLSNYITKTDLSSQSYLTSIPNTYPTYTAIEGMSYVSKTELSGQSYVSSSTLNNYVSKTELSTAGYITSGLPSVTSSDNGKILMVVNGTWQLVSPATIYSGNATPSNSNGNNGDIYIQS